MKNQKSMSGILRALWVVAFAIASGGCGSSGSEQAQAPRGKGGTSSAQGGRAGGATHSGGRVSTLRGGRSGGGGVPDDEPEAAACDTPHDTPTWPKDAALQVEPKSGAVALSWPPAAGADHYAISVDGTRVASVGKPGFTLELAPGEKHTLRVDAIELCGSVAPGPNGTARSLPLPTPADIAPPLSASGITPFSKAVSFLYEGSSPLQIGLTPGAIDPSRVAVIRGKVTECDGTPIPGAKVSVPSEPKLGVTFTRSDGGYDLAVNGCCEVGVQVERAGYPTAQRKIRTTPHDYAPAADVVLVPYDSAVTALTLPSDRAQSAQGTATKDSAGARRATLIVPPGVTASMVLNDGTEAPLSALHVRATEYTSDACGPSAMPAPLPAESAYTYAVELSVDEAVVARAKEVRFSKPVALYVENFLGFPAGSPVPTGYYSRETQCWAPTPNGTVVKLLSVRDGVATIDLNGDGNAEDAAALARLGISTEEARELATLYPVGTTLWRSSLPHFSPWDLNWPYRPKNGSHLPVLDPTAGNIEADFCESGSDLGCLNQSMSETLPLASSGNALRYSSRLEPAASLEFQVTGKEVGSLVSARVEVDVAGVHTVKEFLPEPSQNYRFAWDGIDGYGRRVVGAAPVTVHLTHRYAAGYAAPSDSFGTVGTVGSWKFIAARQELELTVEWKGTLVARTPVTSPASPGWALADHLAFDPVNNAIYSSDGSIRKVAQRVAPSNQLVIDTIAGTGTEDFSGDGGPALGAALSSPRGITFAPDGTLYIADFGNHRIRKVNADGTIQTVAGTGKFDTSSAKQIWVSGSDPLQADLAGPDSLTFDCEGNLFFFDWGLSQYFRLSKDNRLHTIPLRTNNSTYFEGIPGPVEAAVVDTWNSGTPALAKGSDCRVYLAGRSNVFRIDADGQIRRVAGNLKYDQSGAFTEGMDATLAPLTNLGGIAYEPSGSLLIGAVVPGNPFAEQGNGAPAGIFRVTPDGTIRTVAGAHATAVEVSGDNLPALEAGMKRMDGLQASRAKDGSFAFIDIAPGDDGLFGDTWIRHVDRNGVIRTLAGAGALLGEHVPVHDARLTKAWGLAFAPDNSLYVSLNGEHRVRRIASIRGLQTVLEPSSAPPADGIAALVITGASTIANNETAIPDESGGVVDVFDKVTGVHQRTFDSLTGALIRKYTHEGDRLVAISDAYGNTTAYGYDDGGKLSTVTSPYNQVTNLAYDLDGNLSKVTNPAGEEFTITYKTGTALLETLTNPRGKATTFAYDDLGRIVKDSDAAGGSKTLESSVNNGTSATKVTTALGRTNSYSAETTPEGTVKRRSDSRYYGASTTTVTAPNGGHTTTFQDGTTLETSEDADPRFGALSPFAATVTMSKGSQKSVVKTARSYSFSDPNDLLSLTKFSETTNIDGDAYTRSYDRKTNTFTSTTPMVRVTTTKLNDAGQVIEIDAPGVAPVTIEYDDRGRPTTFTQADRVSKLHYDEHGYVDYATDPADRTQYVTHDAVGRLLSTRLGEALDAPTLTSTFDKNGNLRTLKPPGSAEHSLDYTPVELLASYTPPALTGLGPTEYTYNLDRQLTDVTRPDGAKVHMDYEPATARLASIALPAGDGRVAFSYDDANTKELVGTTGPAGTDFTRTFANGVVTALTWKGTVNGVVRKTYDGKFRLDSESVDGIDGRDSFSYDKDGLLTSAGGLTITREASTGRVAGTSIGVIDDSRSYDPTFGEPSSYTAKTSRKTLFDVSYKRDKLGRITERTEAIEETSTRYGYHYDEQGRLDTVTTNGAVTASYSYDSNGNRTERQANGTTQSASFDAQDRLTSFGDASYAYTAAGELISKTAGSSTTRYHYDALGSLRSVTLPSAKAVTYEVDGFGRRVGKLVDGKLVNGYLYRSGTQLKAVTDGSGNVLASFAYGPAQTPTVMNTPSRVYRIIADHLGSVRLVVDANTGAVAQRLDYDEFGRVTQDTNPGFQPFGYAGGLYDPDTQLVHFGARDYDPEIGRWITKDPLLLGGGSNVYAYVGNDPINLTDISGLLAGVPDWLLWLDDHGVLQSAGDFSAGLSSALTFGLSDKLIDATGLGAYGSKCSGAYAVGRYSGFALALGGSIGRLALRGATGAARAGTEVARPFGNLSRAEEFGIQPYNQLLRALRGTGLQAHHLIEKRFAEVLSVNAREMASVAVTRAEHQIFTNAWRAAIPYGAAGTGAATPQSIMQAAAQIYAEYPAILGALGL
ncbi:MAG: RHS repeat-associated core domain-containing protein [Myxococcota bacterium]